VFEWENYNLSLLLQLHKPNSSGQASLFYFSIAKELKPPLITCEVVLFSPHRGKRNAQATL
jgi:hypothetical protein